MKHGANKADELVHGIGVVYHPVGNLPISNAMNAPSPDDQVRNHIRMLFEHGRTGKPIYCRKRKNCCASGKSTRPAA